MSWPFVGEASINFCNNARTDPATMTQREFYHAVARHGGWLGRRGDGRPGWLTLWRGWRRIADYVTGFQLLQQLPTPPPSCV